MSEGITMTLDEEQQALHDTEEVELNLPALPGVTGNKKDAEGQDVLDADYWLDSRSGLSRPNIDTPPRN